MTALPLLRRALVGRLEGGPVEQPDGQAADEDDPEEDEGEGDVRLTLGIAAS